MALRNPELHARNDDDDIAILYMLSHCLSPFILHIIIIMLNSIQICALTSMCLNQVMRCGSQYVPNSHSFHA